MKLEGKTALITGSGRNIGRATALAFAQEGANLVINARTNHEEAESVAAECRAHGVKAISVLADVSQKDRVDSMVATALEEFGQLDILVSTAAVRPHKPFLEVTVAEWMQARGVILDGAFFCTQAVLPSMIDHGFGRIIYLAGDGALRGDPFRAHISAPKMGLVGLARALATEMASHKITVNVVSPGRIDTSRDLTWYPEGGTTNTSNIPVQRLGKPSEIAAACMYLASDDAAFVTGQTLHVNGGASYY